MITKKSV